MSTPQAPLQTRSRKGLGPMKRRIAEFVYGSVYPARWGCRPSPSWFDRSRYEDLWRAITHHHIAEVLGDVLETGVVLGGRTYKLGRYFERAAPFKHITAVNPVDPDFDVTMSAHGRTL